MAGRVRKCCVIVVGSAALVSFAGCSDDEPSTPEDTVVEDDSDAVEPTSDVESDVQDEFDEAEQELDEAEKQVQKELDDANIGG